MKKSDLAILTPQLAIAAQEQLDEWVQDEEGFDEVLGAGGACGLIADAMASVLSENGVVFARIDTEFDGGHEFIAALCDEGVVTIDIPARIYENGAGFVWTKKPGVILSPDDVHIDVVRDPMSEAEFLAEYCDDPSLECSGP